MQVAIVGFGLEGQSALDYWQRQGADITICDQNTDLQLPANVHGQLGAQYLHDLECNALAQRQERIDAG